MPKSRTPRRRAERAAIRNYLRASIRYVTIVLMDEARYAEDVLLFEQIDAQAKYYAAAKRLAKFPGYASLVKRDADGFTVVAEN
jgi:hypothetical protein